MQKKIVWDPFDRFYLIYFKISGSSTLQPRSRSSRSMSTGSRGRWRPFTSSPSRRRLPSSPSKPKSTEERSRPTSGRRKRPGIRMMRFAIFGDQVIKVFSSFHVFNEFSYFMFSMSFHIFKVFLSFQIAYKFSVYFQIILKPGDSNKIMTIHFLCRVLLSS